ncbi:hypothetical protein ACP70R_003830 [Stipagrostis hirtigluma subsp. patula]
MDPPAELGARSMLDGMPQSKKASVAVGDDRISALPDALIHHVMSFLEAREAVRTCVLAWRWRHLWKSMPVVRITGPGHAQQLRKFLDHLLLLRDRSSLEVFLLEFTEFSQDDVPYVNLWIRHALLCQVQKLRVAACNDLAARFPLYNLPFVSQHLTKLQLFRQILRAKFLDFSSCPALKDLKITKCFIAADKIYSGSLKRLNCYQCYFDLDMQYTRTCICAPSLVSLRLVSIGGRTPVFEDMPVIARAVVTFNYNCEDYCINDDPGYCDDATCDGCYDIDDGSAGCVLLKGLSAAKKLELTAEPEMFILKRDLRWCPTFIKLKTLLLSEWCVAGDHRALICILQHSPVLKQLTLQLSEKQEPDSMVPSKAIYSSVEQPFASGNLKRVKVKCDEVNQRVCSILKSLITYGIPFEKITIQQENKSSEFVSVSSVQVSAQCRG